MTHPWHDVTLGEHLPAEFTAVIEISMGSSVKYELDKKTGLLRVDRILYSAVFYPANYGFIPQTLAEDGDPLDVLVLVEAPSFPGCLMEVRPIGVLQMVDQGKKDEKILAVAESDPLYRQVNDASQVPPHTLREIEHFFSIYKYLEDKRTEMAGWGNADAARQIIVEGQKRWK